MSQSNPSESVLWLVHDMHRALKAGLAAVMQRQRIRFAEMVAHARTNSQFYQQLYEGMPERIEDVTRLPITNKKQLMARFNDWAVDREITLEKTRKFARNPNSIGQRFLGKYTVATTSGTTGTPGIFVIDDRAMTVTNAIVLRLLQAWLGFGGVGRILLRGGRMAMTIMPGTHSATAVAAARFRKPKLTRKRIIVLPVHTSLPELVTKLNEFDPAMLAPYASIAKLLATEQEAGRLHINPVLLSCAAEGLVLNDYDRIAGIFKAKVGNSYAATECPFLSYDCEYRWLHVNADWVMIEPVDIDYRPVPPGELSHTVLVSNLANRVQPILRYDLGDSVILRPDPCPCGNPLPAIRVQGRSADMLTFSTERGARISLPPLALEINHISGVELFQIEQRSPASLRVRLRTAEGSDIDQVWRLVHDEITYLLAQHKLSHVTVERSEESPEQSSGGKYRTIVPQS